MKGGLAPPQIVNSVETGSVIVRHREYIGDILATTAFTNRQYPINPGLAQTFPWLSTIANSFEQYRIRGLLFEFGSTSSDALLSSSTSTALGSVIMSTDYDVADPAPTSKREMLNALFASSDKPSQTFIHPLECKKSISAQTILYNRSAAVPGGFDKRLYDFANFNIATEGMQAAGGVLGELWVTYEVEFFKQQYAYVSLADAFAFNSVTSTRPFGTLIGSNVSRGATIGGTISSDGRTYSFPPQFTNGLYLVTFTVQGNAAAGVTPPSLSATTSLVASDYLLSAGSYTNIIRAPIAAATTSQYMFVMMVRINGNNASFTLATDGVAPGVGAGNLFVTRMPDSLVPASSGF